MHACEKLALQYEGMDVLLPLVMMSHVGRAITSVGDMTNLMNTGEPKEMREMITSYPQRFLTG